MLKIVACITLCRKYFNAALAILKRPCIPCCSDGMFMNKFSKLHMHKYEIQNLSLNTKNTAHSTFVAVEC